MSPKIIVDAKIKSRNLGKETGRHSYLIHEHSTSIQVFEIYNFEYKSKLRMLQCAYGSTKATLGTAKFGGGMAAPLPHACIDTPP
jgi:hypothetical protein